MGLSLQPTGPGGSLRLVRGGGWGAGALEATEHHSRGEGTITAIPAGIFAADMHVCLTELLQPTWARRQLGGLSGVATE
jgi:hypothetical protein